MENYNPNSAALNNGNLFGLPVTEEEADFVVIPVPFDATSSYGRGSSRGIQKIQEASMQLDFYSHFIDQAWEIKVFLQKQDDSILQQSDALGQKTSAYMKHLEMHGEEGIEQFDTLINEVNSFQHSLEEKVYAQATAILQKGKTPLVLGGEHSVPLGLFRALNDHHGEFGILQIDAHADLRSAYEGFKQSHASIMHNALQLPKLTKLVQVGIRDICQEEVDAINQDPRINCYYDWDLQRERFEGITWKDQVAKIIADLPQKVYISFDIDGLEPQFCQSTGTPVPGGLSFSQATYLLEQLQKSDKKIIGADLNEVGSAVELDAMVGARILWNIILSMQA